MNLGYHPTYNGGSGSGNDRLAGKEEHDLPFIKAEVVDAFTEASRVYYNATTTTATAHSLSLSESGQLKNKKGQPPKRMISTTTSKKSKFVLPSPPRNHLNPVAYDLATKLHASGLPYASSLPSSSSLFHHVAQPVLTVEHVLKSLTKTEGFILSNTLLAPLHHDVLNNGDDGRNSRSFEEQQQMWDDIGGLYEAKESLLDLIFPLLASSSSTTATTIIPSSTRIQQQQEKYHHDSYYGGLLSNPPGVLLYGPPGCGKTIALFNVAKKIGPCILFVDELDGLFRERGGSSGNGGGGGGSEEHDVNRDLKTEFMQLWDGIHTEERMKNQQSQNVHPSSACNVLVIGATNRPFDVDSAFLRRMPRSIYVGLPDYNTRILVLRSMLRNVPTAEKSGEFSIEEIARCTDGFSPSDLKELLRSAALIPLREARSHMMQRYRLRRKEEENIWKNNNNEN
eukprot:6524143-Ditylum_brightwellii.AAC.1